MPEDYEFSRVPQLAVDAWRYSLRDGRQQFDLQRNLDEALSVAATRSGLDQTRWKYQPAGDGLLVLLPDSGVEPTLVDSFIRELDTWLSRHNHDLVPAAWLRLRVAVHHGPVIPAQLGYAGSGAVDVSRLLDSRPVREALDAAPDANLVLVVSERVFEDVIRQRHTSLSAKDFTRVEIANESKGFHAPAWIRVPGAAAQPAAPASDTVAVAMRFLAPLRDRADFGERVVSSFADVGITLPEDVSFSQDVTLICLSDVSTQVLLGVWVGCLDNLLKAHGSGMRMVIGVCQAFDPGEASRTARELASSDRTMSVLGGPRSGRLAVVVTDQVYGTIKSQVGGMARPQHYRQLDDSSWLRVPGRSVPPEPVEPTPEETAAPDSPNARPIPGSGSANAYGNNNLVVSGSSFGDVVMGNQYRGRDR